MKTYKKMYILSLLSIILLSFSNCSNNDSNGNTVDPDDDNPVTDEYSGTASVSQGMGITTIDNLYEPGIRIATMGTITTSDNTIWTVPAEVNYTDNSFPFAPDLHNSDGTSYNTAEEALAAFDDTNSIEIDSDGDLITGYIFGDNYFELYINGQAVGKDAIPFTEFNSHIVKFKVSRPFTIAMKLVDWEENLGLGTEQNGGFAHHPGDGGMVAVFEDALQNTIAITNSDWKAQTFYTAPIKDLNCPTENGTIRDSSNCNTDSEMDGTSFYGLHWEIPTNWTNEDFDDSSWPNATTYTNAIIGVDNKPSYTNFTDVFDDASNDAQFIWSTNVILDNEVIVRYTVE
ncbi:hypothetical protein [Aquimarina sp. Aq107]|uniref:hypothetical protein n=1 Tax=Aquimarina sp. Aq107 TaxID=1191912 RepID=UPI000D561C6D|nr:hypothetical protein [Aquimarina sp. Aq107]